ncbi:hypothetical protein RNF01_002893 [Salmonella enterica]|nr:hypothetical protein [Salmonella enterica]
MIITGNSTPISAGITSNPASPAGSSGVPASAAPAKLYIPAGDVSRWIGGTDSSRGNQDWKITRGVAAFTWYCLTPTTADGQWEMQHPMPGPEDFFRYGFRVRFSCYFDDVVVATMEGKDLLEVRLVIPDSALPANIPVPAATPDKPYLAVGFVVRCVDGAHKIYDLDTDITSAKATTTIQTVLQGYTTEFALKCDGYSFYGGLTNYQRYLKPIRTGVNTPANTLCIRSGANPVEETAFSYLESVIPRESLSHTLTTEDNNATFYCPWGYSNNLRVMLPDTPLPEGFRVNLVTDSGSYFTVYAENKNVTWNQADGKPSSGSTSTSGKHTLIQTGKNGKTWALI